MLCGLSGGVDSSVVAALLHEAIGDQLTCLFVDHGLLRQGEAEQVVDTFQGHMHIRLETVNSTEAFLTDLPRRDRPGAQAQANRPPLHPRLRRRSRPHRRQWSAASLRCSAFSTHALPTPPSATSRKARSIPDVIESASRSQEQAARTIKTHHNVGGLPEDMTFELIEPLRMLFKDEVRAVGKALGLPEEVVWRHPFPGPGLAIRVLGEVTWERLETLRQADAILLEELRGAGLYRPPRTSLRRAACRSKASASWATIAPTPTSLPCVRSPPTTS